MRILLTGDRGYLGTVMVPYLHGRGHEVTGFDTDYYSAGNLFQPSDGYPRIQKDIRDVSHDDLRGFEAVIHLAALSNDPLGDLSPERTYDINYWAQVI